MPRKYTSLNDESSDVFRAAQGSYVRFRKEGQSFRLERLIATMLNVRRIKFIFTKSQRKRTGDIYRGNHEIAVDAKRNL